MVQGYCKKLTISAVASPGLGPLTIFASEGLGVVWPWRLTELGASDAVRSSRDGDALPTSIASLERRDPAGRAMVKSAAVRPACAASGLPMPKGLPRHEFYRALL